MARCAEVFPEAKVLHSLSATLSWTHFRRLICLDDPLKRDFHAETRRIERWSVRRLHEKIQSMLFERTALSKKPDKFQTILIDAKGGSDYTVNKSIAIIREVDLARLFNSEWIRRLRERKILYEN